MRRRGAVVVGSSCGGAAGEPRRRRCRRAAAAVVGRHAPRRCVSFCRCRAALLLLCAYVRAAWQCGGVAVAALIFVLYGRGGG
jgi:hypothetical protein